MKNFLLFGCLLALVSCSKDTSPIAYERGPVCYYKSQIKWGPPEDFDRTKPQYLAETLYEGLPDKMIDGQLGSLAHTGKNPDLILFSTMASCETSLAAAIKINQLIEQNLIKGGLVISVKGPTEIDADTFDDLLNRTID